MIVLHVHEALSLRRCVEARLSSHAHAHAGTSHQRWPHSADTKFSTRGRRVTDHTVACTSPLTHCPGYLQALEPSARPVQVFRAQLRCASCMLAQWQQHGAHLEPKLSLRLRCTSAWAVARATARKFCCVVAVLAAGTALAALAALAAALAALAAGRFRTCRHGRCERCRLSAPLFVFVSLPPLCLAAALHSRLRDAVPETQVGCKIYFGEFGCFVLRAS